MHINFPSQIHIQLVRSGWLKSSYQFIADDKVIGQLDFEKSYSRKAKGSIDGKEFSIKRRGVWKHYIEINSSFEKYVMRIPLTWRNTMRITDSAGNPYLFKSTSVWKSKWEWFDRHERSKVEIRSKSLSRKNRGLIEIKEAEMKDTLFWIIVSWYVIVCSESDAAVVAAT
jgi:hypothetical protein